jgi:hypothetical protein
MFGRGIAVAVGSGEGVMVSVGGGVTVADGGGVKVRLGVRPGKDGRQEFRKRTSSRAVRTRGRFIPKKSLTSRMFVLYNRVTIQYSALLEKRRLVMTHTHLASKSITEGADRRIICQH